MSATLINASLTKTSIAVWPQMQDAPDPTPIAWLSAALLPESYTVFRWQATYEFIWAATGRLFSGKSVLAAERMAVDLDNPAVLLKKSVPGYQFVATKPPASMQASVPASVLTIAIADDALPDWLAVGINLRIDNGIGQPGNGASVVQAKPGLIHRWTVGETYFAGFGAITQSQYDPPTAGTQPPLGLDFSLGPDIAILLDGANVLKQIINSQALQLLASGRFGAFQPRAEP